MAEGIDVSRHQGTVDWAKVAGSGKFFAVARSTVGQNTVDPTFVANYQGMVRNGLVPGAYHLVTGSNTGPEQAANWKRTLDSAGFKKGLLVLDVEGWAETTNGLEAGTLKATEYLCNWVRDTYGRMPIIYTGVYWRDNLKQHPNNFDAALWLSYYGSNDPQLYVPKAWTTYKVLQYSDTGSVPGVVGNCDLNRSRGTDRSLQTIAGWEWDELATEEQVKTAVSGVVDAAVAKHVNAAVAALKSSDVTEAQKVIAAVSGKVDALASTSNANNQAIVLKLAEVVSALAAHDAEPAGDNTELIALVNDLHKHVCTRVDLH